MSPHSDCAIIHNNSGHFNLVHRPLTLQRAHAHSQSHKDNIKPEPTPRYHVEAADNAKFLTVLEKCSHAIYLEVLLLLGVDGLVFVDDVLGVHGDVFSINTSAEGFRVNLSFIYRI